jgi:hypothetical protein
MVKEISPLRRRQWREIANKVRVISHLNSPGDMKILLEPIQFISYSPYRTFSDPKNKRFLDNNGRVFRKTGGDVDALFEVGREAYFWLSDKHQHDKCASYHKFRRDTHELLAEMKALREVHKSGLNGPNFFGDFEDALEIRLAEKGKAGLWTDYGPLFGHSKDLHVDAERASVYHLFTCLEEIDRALTALRQNARGAITATIAAVKELEKSKAINDSHETFNAALRGSGVKAAKTRHAKSLEAGEKKKVFEQYKLWRSKPHLYRNASEFSRENLKLCKEIEDPRTISRWVREWDKAAK